MPLRSVDVKSCEPQSAEMLYEGECKELICLCGGKTVKVRQHSSNELYQWSAGVNMTDFFEKDAGSPSA